MAESIKKEVIGLLTGHRELTSSERAEIDALGHALSLQDNDPMWGQIAWAWAKLPRFEKLDTEFQAGLQMVAAEIRNDTRSLLAEKNEAAVSDVVNQQMNEIKAMIAAIAERPALPAPSAIDQKLLQSSIAAALSGKKSFIGAEDFFTTFKEVIREIFGWTTAAAAAIAVGICLYVGYSVGEKSQAASDAIASADIKKQNADLEQQVATLTKLVGRNR